MARHYMDGLAVPIKNRRNKHTRGSDMVYQWKIPDMYSVSAQEAGAEIERCRNINGFITPEAVVEKAKAEESVIHGCFEWDDRNAAERYRLHQAGELIRNIVTVSITENDRPSAPIRAFVNIKGEAGRGYKSIASVIRDPGEYAYILECAKNDLRVFTQKYASLEELRDVLTAIREVLR